MEHSFYCIESKKYLSRENVPKCTISFYENSTKPDMSPRSKCTRVRVKIFRSKPEKKNEPVNFNRRSQSIYHRRNKTEKSRNRYYRDVSCATRRLKKAPEPLQKWKRETDMHNTLRGNLHRSVAYKFIPPLVREPLYLQIKRECLTLLSYQWSVKTQSPTMKSVCPMSRGW